MAKRDEPPRLLSHVDLRVRDRQRAIDFYDNLLGIFGASRVGDATDDDDDEWVSWAFIDRNAPDFEPLEWIGITVDPAMTAGSSRIALAAPTRGLVDTVAALLPALGATEIEQPHEAYGPRYYACFFNDPDGNRLEVVHREQARHPRS